MKYLDKYGEKHDSWIGARLAGLKRKAKSYIPSPTYHPAVNTVIKDTTPIVDVEPDEVTPAEETKEDASSTEDEESHPSIPTDIRDQIKFVCLCGATGAIESKPNSRCQYCNTPIDRPYEPKPDWKWVENLSIQRPDHLYTDPITMAAPQLSPLPYDRYMNSCGALFPYDVDSVPSRIKDGAFPFPFVTPLAAYTAGSESNVKKDGDESGT